jgi:peptidoglycan-N-acetylglucosamine deacetylase
MNNTSKVSSNIFYQVKSLALIALSFLIGCNGSERPANKAGICISFDDRYVDEWYSMSNLLDRYDAKVTFFITQFDSLTENELKKLNHLESLGHEIGSHGYMHVESETYIKENFWYEYIENEIIANKKAMILKGFHPTSFAYPYGAKYWFTDFLISRHHKSIRSDLPMNTEKDLTKINDIYYDFDGDYNFYSMGFDNNYELTRPMIAQAMKRAHDNNEVLFLHAHVPDKGQIDKYTFSISLLDFILKEANKQGLKFFIFSDLAE